MFEIKYNVFLDDIWFESLYDTDYYNDKSNFFAHGTRQFFTIYQISRNGDFNFKIVAEVSGEVFEFRNYGDFKKWVEGNYNSFKNYLDNFYWDKHPASKLK